MIPLGAQSLFGEINPSGAETDVITELILGLCPANERRRYKVAPSLIGWAQT